MKTLNKKKNTYRSFFKKSFFVICFLALTITLSTCELFTDYATIRITNIGTTGYTINRNEITIHNGTNGDTLTNDKVIREGDSLDFKLSLSNTASYWQFVCDVTVIVNHDSSDPSIMTVKCGIDKDATRVVRFNSWMNEETREFSLRVD